LIQLKERVGYCCRIDFDYECNQEGKYEIALMVLITFIEKNAFKHGTATIEKCFVTIHIAGSKKIAFESSQSGSPKKRSGFSPKSV
jgi:hypothetical protein